MDSAFQAQPRESMSLMELLHIQPKELSFLFELGKRLTSEIQLVNNTQHYVAFKVLTTHPKKYSVQWPNGIIWPNSTCEVIVTMQVQRTAPSDMGCKDKFLIQSTVVPSWTVRENITSSMFLREEGKYVEEKVLKVEFVSPPLQIYAPFKEKEGLSHKPPKLTNQNNIVQFDQTTPELQDQNAASRPFLLKLKVE
ncbi:vesicle-associated protein 1-1-like [Momordica charantia]|uniref:Vesicle-associated protein 1-1-like n=1 Tax=Momordica charantia TaxID=3673 RepID=A0A6J1CNK4_MOMCH|nr:vesicle-associated protein 1-1-like [Momordica charantia]